MRVAVTVIGAILLAATVMAASDEQFSSKKVVNEEHIVAANLYTGTFFTRQDHTRPQQRDLHLFVIILQCGKCPRLFQTLNCLCIGISCQFELVPTWRTILHLHERWR